MWLLCALVAAGRVAAGDHWAFRPLRPPAVPEPEGAQWARTPADRFILARLRAAGLEPSPEADRRVLIRRLSFNLLGLPPDPDEVGRFLDDGRPDAYERLADRLLASPRYGERWARHWLDIVRFAETNGFETNTPRPRAWPYRDYVIRAFNEDRPYDRFVLDQLAGDRTGEDAATGFLVGGPYDTVKSPDLELTLNQRANELHDMIVAASGAFLALTAGCARCHDHKFDPIPQRDYYRLAAIFAGVFHGEREYEPGDAAERAAEAAELEAEREKVDSELARLEPPANAGRVVIGPDGPWLPGSGRFEMLREPSGRTAYSAGCAQKAAGAGPPGPPLGRGGLRWSAREGEDLAAWRPGIEGLTSVWVSWGEGLPGAAPALYVLDRDGDLGTREDQEVLGRIEARGGGSTYAERTSSRGGRGSLCWSGLHRLGTFRFEGREALVLRAAGSGEVSADLAVFERERGDSAASGTSLGLAWRRPVDPLRNIERFAPVRARRVRFTVFQTNSAEPCIDELEVFTAGEKPRNVALAARGARARASSVYAGDPKHRLEHINDGRYGNGRSWISAESGGGWVEIEFARTETIDRIVWARDREGRYKDRLALRYRIEVETESGEIRAVASSADRLPPGTAVQEDGGPRARLEAERRRIEKRLQELRMRPRAYAGVFRKPPPTHVLKRGDPLKKGEEVNPGGLSRIGPALEIDPSAPESERRLALARWITSPENPLAARVIANRLWLYHFGEGIVSTPSDFGLNGARPSHPALLDHLASELVRSRWSLKRLQRAIVLSATYRQTSAVRPEAAARDAGTRLLWRYPPRRLEAEAIRDSILAVSGALQLRMYGPGYDVFEPNDNYVHVYIPKRRFGPEEWRRMVYQFKPRMEQDETFGVFDCPDAAQPAPKRPRSTTPLQALNLLNSPFVLEQAEIFAERLRRAAGAGVDARIERAFRLAFSRPPSGGEIERARALVSEFGLSALARVLFNANEFLFVE